MKINKAGLEIVKEAEGLRLETYTCPGGVRTIGWGHTRTTRPNQVITEAEADALLAGDLHVFEEGVWKATKDFSPTENQFSAMVSLAFNIGLGAFLQSSVLRTFRAGDLEGARSSFAVWNKARGKILPGLIGRREKEARLFGTP